MNQNVPTPDPVSGVCFRCEYDLSATPRDGSCPECGLAVEASIGRFLLAEADPAYLRALHSGVFLVLAAIIILILNTFAIFGVNFSAGLNQGQPPVATTLFFNIIALCATVLLLVGWWRFSTPNPNTTEGYSGSQSRQWVRILLISTAGVTLLQTGVTVLMIVGGVPPVAIGVAVIALTLLGLGIGVARFFCEMFYLRWMAPLIPSRRVDRRAKLLMWLGPLLMTVGILLLGLGPLIALVLYWNMLDWIRKDLKEIRAMQAATPATA